MSNVVSWLESPEGEEWSRAQHGRNRTKALVALKPMDKKHPNDFKGYIFYTFDPAAFLTIWGDDWKMI